MIRVSLAVSEPMGFMRLFCQPEKARESEILLGRVGATRGTTCAAERGVVSMHHGDDDE